MPCSALFRMASVTAGAVRKSMSATHMGRMSARGLESHL